MNAAFVDGSATWQQQEHDVCKACAKMGIVSRVRQFFINFEESVPLCQTKMCMYPMSLAFDGIWQDSGSSNLAPTNPSSFGDALSGSGPSPSAENGRLDASEGQDFLFDFDALMDSLGNSSHETQLDDLVSQLEAVAGFPTPADVAGPLPLASQLEDPMCQEKASNSEDQLKVAASFSILANVAGSLPIVSEFEDSTCQEEAANPKSDNDDFAAVMDCWFRDSSSNNKEPQTTIGHIGSAEVVSPDTSVPSSDNPSFAVDDKLILSLDNKELSPPNVNHPTSEFRVADIHQLQTCNKQIDTVAKALTVAPYDVRETHGKESNIVVSGTVATSSPLVKQKSLKKYRSRQPKNLLCSVDGTPISGVVVTGAAIPKNDGTRICDSLCSEISKSRWTPDLVLKKLSLSAGQCRELAKLATKMPSVVNKTSVNSVLVTKDNVGDNLQKKGTSPAAKRRKSCQTICQPSQSMGILSLLSNPPPMKSAAKRLWKPCTKTDEARSPPVKQSISSNKPSTLQRGLSASVNKATLVPTSSDFINSAPAICDMDSGRMYQTPTVDAESGKCHTQRSHSRPPTSALNLLTARSSKKPKEDVAKRYRRTSIKAAAAEQKRPALVAVEEKDSTAIVKSWLSCRKDRKFTGYAGKKILLEEGSQSVSEDSGMHSSSSTRSGDTTPPRR